MSTLPGIVILVSEEQLSNAYQPISFNPVPKVTLSRPVQFANASLSIIFILFGITTLFIVVLSLNIASSISVTSFPL